MTLLILGLALWIVPHWMKRLAPEMRAGWGDKAKGPLSLAMVLGIVLILFMLSAWAMDAVGIHAVFVLVIIDCIACPAPNRSNLDTSLCVHNRQVSVNWKE